MSKDTADYAISQLWYYTEAQGDKNYPRTHEYQEAIRAYIAALEAENEKLSKIAAFVPGKIYIEAKERAGFGEAIIPTAPSGAWGDGMEKIIREAVADDGSSTYMPPIRIDAWGTLNNKDSMTIVFAFRSGEMCSGIEIPASKVDEICQALQYSAGRARES